MEEELGSKSSQRPSEPIDGADEMRINTNDEQAMGKLFSGMAPTDLHFKPAVHFSCQAFCPPGSDGNFFLI